MEMASNKFVNITSSNPLMFPFDHTVSGDDIFMV